MSEQKSTLLRLGGLWSSEGKAGCYLSGRFGNVRLYIFENRHRRGDKDPSHVLCLGAADDRPAKGSASTEDEDAAF